MCDVDLGIGGQRECCLGEDRVMLNGLGFVLHPLIPIISEYFTNLNTKWGNHIFFSIFSPAQLATQFLTNITVITMSHL